MSRSLLAVALAALVLLAGCAGGVPSTLDDSTVSTDGSGSGSVGHMNFYVSDEQNAIEDFEHLNATITMVGFQQAGDDGEDAEADENDDENETDSDDGDTYNVTVDGNVSAGENVTITVTNETGVPIQNATVLVNEDPVGQTDTDGHLDVTLPDEDEIEIEVESEAADEEATTTTDAESESGDADAAGWVERDVDGKTVDLTELQGANASLLAQFDVPAGEYNGAMVYISEVNGTLKTGEQVNVKLPSEKLHVNTPFTVGDGEEVDFVFDITVKKAGNSGKYILRPVVTESGTNVEKRVVGEDADEEDEGDESDESHDGDTYNVTVDGNVSAGENVTITVTNETGVPVQNATVTVNGETVGETDADGQLAVTVPDVRELEIEVEDESGEGSVELRLSDGDAVSEDPDAGSDDGVADDAEEDDADAESGLTVEFTTNVSVGEDATLVVTDGSGTTVPAADVTVNGDAAGKTDVDGTLTVTIPSDAEEVEVTVQKGNQEAELEFDLDAEE